MSVGSSESLPVPIHKFPDLSSTNDVTKQYFPIPDSCVRSRQVFVARSHRRNSLAPPVVAIQKSPLESSKKRKISIPFAPVSIFCGIMRDKSSKRVVFGSRKSPPPVGNHQSPLRSCQTVCFQPQPK